MSGAFGTFGSGQSPAYTPNGGFRPQFGEAGTNFSYGSDGFTYTTNQPQQVPQQAPAPLQMPISQAVHASEPIAPLGPPPAPDLGPVAQPPPMQTGQIQAALGIPPTSELANKYRYNPWWKPV